MEKAWIDFKTDEETFKLIMKYEEEYVSDIMKKKYGKDFDGIHVKSAIKKSDSYKYTLADLLIKADIECVEKLNAKHKNVTGFFSNIADLMTRKLCLVYDLKPVDLESIISHLSSEYRDIFVYTFGINRKKVKMAVIVSMFNMDTESVYKNLIAALHEFDSIAKEKKNKVVISNQNEDRVNSPSVQVLSNVDGQKNKFNLIKFYEEKGYTVKEFIEAYRSLNLSDQELIKREFDRKFDEVNNPTLTKDEYEKVNLITKSDNAGIGKLLKQVRENEIKEKEKTFKDVEEKLKNEETGSIVSIKNFQTLNDYYKVFGVDVEDLDDAYKHLKTDEQEIFNKYINTIENNDGSHIFYIKKDIASASVNDIYFFTVTFLKVIVMCRMAADKEIDQSRLPDNFINLSKNYYRLREIRINKYQTLNDYYKYLGIPEEILEEKYKKLTRAGKKHFVKYIDVIENNGKQIFKIIKPITQNDYSSFWYFTKIFADGLLKYMKTEQLSSEPTECISEEKSVNETDAPSNQQPKSLEAKKHTSILSFIDVRDAIIDYLKMLKETGIISKDLIINLHLPKKSEFFLLTEFNLNGSNEFSLDEEAEFLNMDLEELCKNLFEAIKSFKSSLNSELTVDKQKLESLLAIDNPSDDGETEIKKTLE